MVGSVQKFRLGESESELEIVDSYKKIWEKARKRMGGLCGLEKLGEMRWKCGHTTNTQYPPTHLHLQHSSLREVIQGELGLGKVR